MLQPVLQQQSDDCWDFAIPKSFAFSPPLIQLGQLARLSKWFQQDPGIVHYGKVVGISWEIESKVWIYTIQPSISHRYYEDSDSVWEEELLQLLIEDGFLEGETIMNSQPENSQPDDDAIEQEIIELFLQLDPVARENLLASLSLTLELEGDCPTEEESD